MQQLLREVGPAVDAALRSGRPSGAGGSLAGGAQGAQEKRLARALGRGCEADGLCLLHDRGLRFAPAQKGEPLTPGHMQRWQRDARARIESVAKWSDKLEEVLRLSGMAKGASRGLEQAIRAALLPAVDHLLHSTEVEFTGLPGGARLPSPRCGPTCWKRAKTGAARRGRGRPRQR